MSSRLVTSARQPVGGLLDGLEQRGLVLGGEGDLGRCAGSPTDALTAASGVRRSWETAASSAVRVRSASASRGALDLGHGRLPALAPSPWRRRRRR